jgi:hypothetical protein
MKTIAALFLISFFSPVFNGSLKGQNLSIPNAAAIEKQVDSAFMTMVKIAERLDYDKLSNGVDDRYKAGFLVNDSFYADYVSLMRNFGANVQSGTKQSITIQEKKITVLSDTIVLLSASGYTNVQFNSGGMFTTTFLWSFVYVKFNNDWKVIHSHQSLKN